MADGTVGVRQTPGADRLIDNEAITVPGDSVYRQRIQVGGAALGELAGVSDRPLASGIHGLATRPVADRTLLDYDGRLDGNPVYVGSNGQAALVAGTNWVVKKLFYDSLSRLVDAQVLTGSWTGRAALAWKPAGGD